MVCFVQGLGIIQIALVMCVADCEPITGKSVQWTVIGVIDSFVGIGFVWAGQRRVNR
ncbi:hypothetical protein [Haladaptatus litoreus]|nr:hypothetical protein [Haladaptatus litoreus]